MHRRIIHEILQRPGICRGFRFHQDQVLQWNDGDVCDRLQPRREDFHRFRKQPLPAEDPVCRIRVHHQRHHVQGHVHEPPGGRGDWSRSWNQVGKPPQRGHCRGQQACCDLCRGPGVLQQLNDHISQARKSHIYRFQVVRELHFFRQDRPQLHQDDQELCVLRMHRSVVDEVLLRPGLRGKELVHQDQVLQWNDGVVRDRIQPRREDFRRFRKHTPPAMGRPDSVSRIRVHLQRHHVQGHVHEPPGGRGDWSRSWNQVGKPPQRGHCRGQQACRDLRCGPGVLQQ